MKFSEKYPDMMSNDKERDCIIKGNSILPCVECGEPTPFIDICFEGHFCSEECLYKFGHELFQNLIDSYEQKNNRRKGDKEH